METPTSQPDSKDSKLLVAFFIAAFIIFLLILYIILRKPEVVTHDPGREKVLRDSIETLTEQIKDERSYTNKYKNLADSYASLPPLITVIYREQKKFTSVATVNQLDSIIRVSSGLKPRIKRYH
jgi:hypothetical protein